MRLVGALSYAPRMPNVHDSKQRHCSLCGDLATDSQRDPQCGGYVYRCAVHLDNPRPEPSGRKARVHRGYGGGSQMGRRQPLSGGRDPH